MQLLMFDGHSMTILLAFFVSYSLCNKALGLYDLRLICDNISSSFHGLVVTIK